MTDIDLLALGCVVTFIAVGGAYMYMRERYLDDEESLQEVQEPVRTAGQKPGRAA